MIARTIVVATVVSLAFVSSSRADLSDNFDTGANGWTMVVTPTTAQGNDSFSAPAAGGLPNGFLQITHTFNPQNPSDPFYTAPATYLGDKSSYYGAGELNFDYFAGYTQSLPTGLGRVQLEGNGTILVYTFTLPSQGQQWYPVSVPLNASDLNWKVTGTGNQPTASDFQNVLSNLDELWIDGINGAGPQSTGLDNVALLSTPEPASAACLFVAGIMLLGKRR